MTQPLTTAEIRLAQYGERTSTWSTATYNDGTEKALHEIALGLKAEVDRLRAELATARVQSLRDLADKADPQRPEISFFDDHGHTVGAWIRKQAEYEERRLAAAQPVRTPCSAPECDFDGTGEPCTRHEREAAHAEGDHDLCGDECKADRCTCDSEDHTHDGGCPLYAAAVSAAARP